MKRLPNGSVLIVNSPVFIEVVLVLFAAALFAAAWFQLQQHPPKYFPAVALLIGALLLVAGMLAQQQRTYLFDPSLQRLKWTCRSLFKNSSGAMPFSDISEVRLESMSDSDGGDTYRAALVTPAGLMPLSNSYTGNRKKVAEFAASVSQVIGRESH
jgi:hypothetical protein